MVAPTGNPVEGSCPEYHFRMHSEKAPPHGCTRPIPNSLSDGESRSAPPQVPGDALRGPRTPRDSGTLRPHREFRPGRPRCPALGPAVLADFRNHPGDPDRRNRGNTGSPRTSPHHRVLRRRRRTRRRRMRHQQPQVQFPLNAPEGYPASERGGPQERVSDLPSLTQPI